MLVGGLYYAETIFATFSDERKIQRNMMTYKQCAAGLLLATSFSIAATASAYAMEINENRNMKETAVSVSGRIVDKSGEPLVGVVVSTDDGRNAVTDENGRYQISASEGAQLHLSYIGYRKMNIKASNGQTITMEEDAYELGDVVVTTQKRRQTAIEVPVSVSALSGGVLDRLNLQQMDEMATFIPGLEVQIQSPNTPGYVIRGVTSDGGESYSQPRISVFLDGVSITRRQASTTELFDMERVEVVKGPQGTLFGRSAEIGAMHFLRNRPTNQLSGELKLNYGTHNQRGAEGFINTPIHAKLANRFAFSYDAHDGYIKNQADGRLNGKSAIALRNSTRLLAGDNTTMNFVLDYQYDNYPGTSFKGNLVAPLYGGDTSPFTEAYLNGGKDLGITRHNGGAAFLLDHTFSPSLKLSSITGFRAYKSNETFDADGTYLPLLYCQENVKGTQFSQEFRLNWDNGGPVSGFLGASYFYEHAQQNVVAESNLQYTFPMLVGPSMKQSMSGLPTQVANGVSGGIDAYVAQLKAQYPDYATMIDQMMGGVSADINSALTERMNGLMNSWFSSSTWQTTPNFYGDTNAAVNEVLTSALTQLMTEYPMISQLLGGASASDIAASLSGQVSSSLSSLQAYSNLALAEDYQENSTNYAINQAADIFADATWHIYKGLSLTAGLRGTYEHLKTGYSSTSGTLPLLGTALLYQSSEGKRVWASGDYWSWVGRVALNYMFGRNNVYASISRGRRPGVISFNNDPTDIVRLKPEIIVNYEAGIKGNVLKNRLNYDFSIFYYDWSHFQSTHKQQTESGAFEDVASDAGKAHTFGVELGLRYNFTPLISVFGNYAYLDGKFNDKDGDGMEQVFAGKRFRLTPKHSFALGVDANFPVSKDMMLYLRPSYTYKSKVYFEDENTEALSQDGYGLLNCTLGLQKKWKKFYYEVGLYGKNMLNEKYLIDAGNSGNNIGSPTFIAGAPSVYGVQFKIGF